MITLLFLPSLIFKSKLLMQNRVESKQHERKRNSRQNVLYNLSGMNRSMTTKP